MKSVRSLAPSERLLSALLRLVPIKNGKHRLLNSISDASWIRGANRVRFAWHGFELEMNVDDLVDWHFVILGDFDPEVSEVLSCVAEAQGGEVFWDIGANSGTCSYAMLQRLGSLKIVAIEPQSDLAECISLNLDRMASSDFEVFAVAIGVQHEKLSLSIPNGNKGKASLVSKDYERSIDVDVVTAEMIYSRSGFGWPTLAKIDVEGYEAQVVESLVPALASNVCKAIVFESHPKDEESFSRIYSVVTRFGYTILAIRKTLFTTKLHRISLGERVATDYLIVRNDILASSSSLCRLMS